MTEGPCRVLEDHIAVATQALSARAPSSSPSCAAGGLSQDVEVCRCVTATHSRTFYLASALLPRAKREAIRCLYAFCRTTDDLVDLAGSDPHRELMRWREAALGATDYHDHPILRAWHEVRVRYGIPLLFAAQLIDAVGLDMERKRYATFSELADYCYGVASTVGLMSMCIIGYEDPAAVRYAVCLGMALQLTNILRDVGEDWGRGRLYLPAEELACFGLSETDVGAACVDDRWRDFMQFQIARNRRLYEEAWPGIALLHADGQLAVAAAARLYASILEDIERHDYQVFQRRARVTTVSKLMRLPGIWSDLRRLRTSARSGNGQELRRRP
ncbi:MAG: phytoene/squalene synthase family protein [Armatimonadetes bacterium]|nr:phytoene/squalene synthase family protein [Armatimonadota bacterium]